LSHTSTSEVSQKVKIPPEALTNGLKENPTSEEPHREAQTKQSMDSNFVS